MKNIEEMADAVVYGIARGWCILPVPPALRPPRQWKSGEPKAIMATAVLASGDKPVGSYALAETTGLGNTSVFKWLGKWCALGWLKRAGRVSHYTWTVTEAGRSELEKAASHKMRSRLASNDQAHLPGPL